MPTEPLHLSFDLGAITTWLFWFFFAGLIYYLRREDHREGYPMQPDAKDRTTNPGWPIPDPKTFVLPFGGGERTAPHPEKIDANLKAEPIGPWPGAALVPTGDPMLAGVGPGAYATRPERPDLTVDGHPKLSPLRVAKEFFIAEGDPDPRGMEVVGADDVVAGKIVDVWVDRGEPQIRYLEVGLTGGKNVMLPINFSQFNKKERRVRVVSILGSQFVNVPVLANPDQITLQEEDKVMAYYGGGTMYATPDRGEPYI